MQLLISNLKMLFQLSLLFRYVQLDVTSRRRQLLTSGADESTLTVDWISPCGQMAIDFDFKTQPLRQSGMLTDKQLANARSAVINTCAKMVDSAAYDPMVKLCNVIQTKATGVVTTRPRLFPLIPAWFAVVAITSLLSGGIAYIYWSQAGSYRSRE